MTLDEAIKHCHEKAEEERTIAINSSYSDTYIADCLECAKDHEQLAKWLTELQERREADRWIPVSERKPDKEGKYIIFTDYGDVTMDSFVDGIFVCNLGNVTHWRPFPQKPYESEDK